MALSGGKQQLRELKYPLPRPWDVSFCWHWPPHFCHFLHHFLAAGLRGPRPRACPSPAVTIRRLPTTVATYAFCDWDHKGCMFQDREITPPLLRDPREILFITRDAYSDDIPNILCACIFEQSAKEGHHTLLGGEVHGLRKYLAIRGCRSNSIAIPYTMWPQSSTVEGTQHAASVSSPLLPSPLRHQILQVLLHQCPPMDDASCQGCLRSRIVQQQTQQKICHAYSK